MTHHTSKKILNSISWFVTAVLFFFSLRRWLFLLTALSSKSAQKIIPPQGVDLTQIHVLLLVPIRNEADTLLSFLTILDKLVYDQKLLTVVLIDDGSTDNSRPYMQLGADQHENWHTLYLSENVGKADALNAALKQFPQGDLVAIYDVDERPLSNALQRLVRPFANDRVGGVSGRRAVRNALSSPIAGYIAFEALVHQMVTMQAKDRLNLAPAILGANCAYRRTALDEVGNFKSGALLEDSDLTLKLVRAGWKICFEPTSVSYHDVPETISGYWQQHTRWARGFNEVAKSQGPSLLKDRDLPFLVRLELFTFALGYLDRLALFLGGILACFKLQTRKLLLFALSLNLLAPFFQIIAALKLGQAPSSMGQKIIWLPLFLILDIAMSLTGFWTTLMKIPQSWEERRIRK